MRTQNYRHEPNLPPQSQPTWIATLISCLLDNSHPVQRSLQRSVSESFCLIWRIAQVVSAWVCPLPFIFVTISSWRASLASLICTTTWEKIVLALYSHVRLHYITWIPFLYAELHAWQIVTAAYSVLSRELTGLYRCVHTGTTIQKRTVQLVCNRSK